MSILSNQIVPDKLRWKKFKKMLSPPSFSLPLGREKREEKESESVQNTQLKRMEVSLFVLILMHCAVGEKGEREGREESGSERENL